MPRVSILDSILNRPSQSYAAEVTLDKDKEKGRNVSSSQWAPPPDLPGAQPASSSVLSSGGIFRKKSSKNISGVGSDAGTSIGRSTTTSRFGRKKRSSTMPGTYTYNEDDLGSQYAPSSVADNSTVGKKKSRWWETGSMSFGRRSRTPSIAGDSIFSEPSGGPPLSPGWPGMAGIGSGANKSKVTRSDYGTGPRSNVVPPMPKLDSKYFNAAPPGRLQSNVAPLGATNLNPVLNAKPSQTRLSSVSQSNLRKNDSMHRSPPARMSSPTPSNHDNRPPIRSMSPAFSDSGHSFRSATSQGMNAGQDWKEFVKTMSGTDISKVWEGPRGQVTSIDAARAQQPGVNGVERRKSNMMRLQKELQDEAQYEQVIRDPGVINQDLLVRAASHVVGNPPNVADNGAGRLSSTIRPGSIVSPITSGQISSPPVTTLQAPALIVASSPPIANGTTASPAYTPSSSSEEEDGEEEEEDSEGDSDDSEEQRKPRLEAVSEEEESSSVGHEMRPHHPVAPPSLGGGALGMGTAKYRAFEAALKRTSHIGSATRHSTPSPSQPLAPSPSKTPDLSSNGHMPTSSRSSNTSGHVPEEQPVKTSTDLSPASSGEQSPLPSTAAASAATDSLPPLPMKDAIAAGSIAALSDTDTDAEEEVLTDSGPGVKDKDRSDVQSIKSTLTGRATVKFDQVAKEEDKDDALSVKSRASTSTSKPKSLVGSRPPTLARRLSDLSLGTTFGASGMFGSASRSSSRKLRIHDDDSDSAKSSDEEVDNEMRARIKAEQERLRSIKVGEDFFGGSLSSILNKFGTSDWEVEGPSNIVNQLDLDVGSSSKSVHRDSALLSGPEILTINAQERVNEIRRLRAESPSTSQGKDNSDAITVQSGIAPSFAALWLLNQPDTVSSKAGAETAAPSEKGRGHARQISTASSESNSSRLKNFFGIGSSTPSTTKTTVADVSEKRASVLDRPRNRPPKPKEMGGVPISQGKLAPHEKGEIEEDTRSTLPQLFSSTQLKNSGSTTSPTLSSRPSSPPMSPIVKPTELPSSKDKPAPQKSALKPKKSKSLADTLFSFSSSSPEKKRNRKQRSIDAGVAQGRRPADAESKKSIEAEEKEARPAVIPPAALGGTLQSESSTSSPNEAGGKMVSYYTAQDLSKEEDNADIPEQADTVFSHSSANEGEESTKEHAESPPLPGEGLIPAAATSLPNQHRLEERTPSSELWSGESAVSNGPPTPALGESLSPSLAMQTTYRPDETRMEKKLPMPPMPSFQSDTSLSMPIEGDATPLAVIRPDPIHVDQNRTPMAEVREPSFGINLIPPTPPALESRGSYTSVSSQAHRGVAEDVVPEEEVISSSGPLERSHSRSNKQIGDMARKTSKRKSTNAATLSEYQGASLHLPAGLVATTVASSSSRRHSTDGPVRTPSTTSNPSTDATMRRRKSTGKKSSSKLSRTYANEQEGSNDTGREKQARRSSSVLRQGLADAPPIPGMPHSSSSLVIPNGSHSETASSIGSDSGPVSRSGSVSTSPAPSASGRSAVSSSNASMSAASDASLSRQQNRKIRTLSPGPNGHARTSVMSSISEWESSPIDTRRGSLSPMTGYADSPASASLVSPSQSSVHMGLSPALVRNAPMGAPTEAYLRPTASLSTVSDGHARSLDGHGTQKWRSSFMSVESDLSGINGAQSMMSIPSAPQSSYRPQDPIKSANTIDDRLYAKTTMTTVAVTSGAYRSKSLRKRRSAVDVASGVGDSARQSRTSIDTMPEGLSEELHRTTMSMTAHTPPPRKLTSTQVLVQIIACAIDESDRLILRDKVQSESAYGFVPGRSFCGRVMETGWEVKRLRKGDMVFGLQSSRKCGALAEFMTVEQDLVAKAPEDCLTTEEIAALPAVGVMVYQTMTKYCSQLKRGSRILILNAHDGVGLLTMQESASLGFIIVAHCPESVSDGVMLCEANGAHEVVIGEPLWALNSLHESSFDLVLDTIGGRRIYDASRRILAHEGQFCTFIGDMQSSLNPNLKTHFRSLRRSFFKKDTKRIGYELISTDTAEDCQEALQAVKFAAEQGRICPRLQSILPFGEAPRAFESTLRGGQTEPGSIVVRVS